MTCILGRGAGIRIGKRLFVQVWTNFGFETGEFGSLHGSNVMRYYNIGWLHLRRYYHVPQFGYRVNDPLLYGVLTVALMLVAISGG